MRKLVAIPLLLLIYLALNGCAAPHSPSATEQNGKGRRYVNADALNLRACPGAQCRVIRALRLGESCVLVRESSGWAEIVTSGTDSVTGWVATQYLSSRPVAKNPRASKGGKKASPAPALPAEELATPGKETASPPAPPPQEEFAQ